MDKTAGGEQARPLVLDEVGLRDVEVARLLVGDIALRLDAGVAVLAHLAAEDGDRRDDADVADRSVVAEGHAVAAVVGAGDGMALALEDAAVEVQPVALEVLDVEVHELPAVEPAVVGEAFQADRVLRRAGGEDRAVQDLHAAQRDVLGARGNADGDGAFAGVVEVGDQLGAVEVEPWPQHVGRDLDHDRPAQPHIAAAPVEHVAGGELGTQRILEARRLRFLALGEGRGCSGRGGRRRCGQEPPSGRTHGRSVRAGRRRGE